MHHIHKISFLDYSSTLETDVFTLTSILKFKIKSFSLKKTTCG